MGYSTKNTAKHERKLGMDAMRTLVNDPNFDPQATLALAQQELDNFKKFDDLPNDLFCRCMKELRETRPDIYSAFWWWRDAETKAGRRKEEDGGEPETKYRAFMVTQFLREPFGDEWEDDRKTLKPGVDPWITEEQIAKGLDHKTIKRWAWVWHDKDIYTEEDEITDRTGQIKAGDMKFKHAHIVLDIPGSVPVSTVARWFDVPPQQVTVLRGRGAFLDGVEYLPHESPRAVEQFKTHYDDEDIHASPGFDFRKELQDLQAHRAKYGKRAGDMTPADTMRMHVMHDNWTMKMCRDDDPLTYAKIRSTLPGLRLDYLLDAPPCPFRINIYIDGPGGIGKSSFCEYIAQALFPSVEDPYFTIGNDERVTFDGYDGQPVIIWDDVRVTDFIRQFGGNGAFRILDPHPKKVAQQAKHSRVILCNAVNILNGVQPYKDFIAGLAGTYVDKDGRKHEAEDENQAWRRFPMILCIRADSFDVLLNQGFVDNDLSSVQTMQQYAHVRGCMKAMMERLEGTAKSTALLNFGQPVLDGVEEVKKSHLGEKISDPDQIPPELMPVVTYHAGSVAQAKQDTEERARQESDDKQRTVEEEYRVYQQAMYRAFAIWFWSSVSGGLAWYIDKHRHLLDRDDAGDLLCGDYKSLEAGFYACKDAFYYTYNSHHSHCSTLHRSELPELSDALHSYPLRDAYAFHGRNEGLFVYKPHEIISVIQQMWTEQRSQIPPLNKDRNYELWRSQILGKDYKDGHKLCIPCGLDYPYDTNFCCRCGKPLPDKLFYGEAFREISHLQWGFEPIDPS